MSLRKVVSKYHKTGDIEVICKSTMNYIKNALSVFSVSISDFNKIQPWTGYGYIINENLENILKKYIPNLDFPKKAQIIQSKKNKSQLTVEIITVVKNFIEANFNDDKYTALRKKVNDQIEEIETSFRELSTTYMDYANTVNENRLCYMVTQTLLEQRLQSILNIRMSLDVDNYNFEDIIDLINISKQLQDIIKIINRCKCVQDGFEAISTCL